MLAYGLSTNYTLTCLHGYEAWVETNNKPLVDPSGRLLRWVLSLQDYIFTLHYHRNTEKYPPQWRPNPTSAVPITLSPVTPKRLSDGHCPIVGWSNPVTLGAITT